MHKADLEWTGFPGRMQHEVGGGRAGMAEWVDRTEGAAAVTRRS